MIRSSDYSRRIGVSAVAPAARSTRLAAGVCLLAAAMLHAGACRADALQPLPALNIDITQTSLSGISSGGFMAAQFQVAHSSIVKGAGIVAGGPFYCSQNSVVTATTRCSCTGEPYLHCAVSANSADVPALLAATASMFSRKLIDDPANLQAQRVISIAGGKDALVPKPIAAQLADYYRGVGVPAQNISMVTLDNAGHTLPTTDFGKACALTEEPYLGKCGFDSARSILGWIYGPLQPRTGNKAKGRFIRFDQKPFIPNDESINFAWNSGIDSSGWVYVPDSCARGAPCRLHIALHGCKQGQSYLPLQAPPGGGLYYGTTFVRNAGYDRWADNNRLVILFPQALSIPARNPNGCWDWWGYTGANYANQKGVQILALRAMTERLAAGARR
ncbi:extracellular catalytic domain type 2 short-chain-length polyhydroxyalkanoate depolymerase [Rhodocyclus tenuis]|uniref:Poly(3-hydroxybutyrate) depolymerase n=1 Tax=Rhodocyclus tenuis TaxID=1066 RepID=A0A840G856_RHOTE|nr:poly(3-hydroxybutyrate) depolymerase [Rhodocyclus tenuis]MBB4248065.1 poly(3-hydroxybutyrate) depolymerase [Rhodocyclus tenuis]